MRKTDKKKVVMASVSLSEGGSYTYILGGAKETETSLRELAGAKLKSIREGDLAESQDANRVVLLKMTELERR